MAKEKNNFKIMLISMMDAYRLFRGNIRITNIPEFTRFVSCSWEVSRSAWLILLKNESFDDIPFGQQYPVFPAEFEEIKKA
jgi:hypothetical protein